MPAMLRFPLECSTVNKTEKQVGSCSRNSSDMSSSQPQSGNWYQSVSNKSMHHIFLPTRTPSKCFKSFNAFSIKSNPLYGLINPKNNNNNLVL